jgi:hypothetical protein
MRAGFATLRGCDLGAVLRGLATFTATRVVATFIDSLAMAFTPNRLLHQLVAPRLRTPLRRSDASNGEPLVPHLLDSRFYYPSP